MIGKYKSASEAALSVGNKKYSGNILKCCNKKQKTAYGFIWIFEGDKIPDNLNEKKKKVAQIDVNTNEVINIFESAAEAQKQTGCNSSMILKVCKGKGKTAHGYKWSYV